MVGRDWGGGGGHINTHEVVKFCEVFILVLTLHINSLTIGEYF